MTNRRNFLKQSSLIALAPTVPGFLANYARANPSQADETVLVVIQLDGGNDGVNTLVPYTDEGYRKHRKELVIETDRLHKLDDQFGLHPQMRMMADLWQEGRLALVPGVGYPNPNRSHNVSMAIWQSCRFKTSEHKTYGWLGQGFNGSRDGAGEPTLLQIGDAQPQIALQGRKSLSGSISRIDDIILPEELNPLKTTSQPKADDPEGSLRSFLNRSRVDAFAMSDQVEQLVGGPTSGERYPESKLGNHLKLISQLIQAGFGTRVYYAIQPGYDTHAGQLRTHPGLLRELSDAIGHFSKDLKNSGLDDRVAILCFSEFGRRVDENGSVGTDHGTSGLAMLAGKHVNTGIHGQHPKLTELDDGGMQVTNDFRRIYASVLQDWLQVDSASALGGDFEPLDLFS